MRSIETNGVLVCYPTGRIDINNAAAFEQELTAALAEHPGAALVLDAGELEYISSAGLRVLLRQRQAGGELTLRNVSQAVYEILDVTGFNSMLKVEKALRFVSVKGLEQIGAGKHSVVYRLDGETILKVVKDMTLEAILAEVKISKDVLFYGIPTAISYDVVCTEEGYGEVYEMFQAGLLASAVMAEPERREEYLRSFAEMYRAIHAVQIDEGRLVSVRDRYRAAAEALAPLVTEEEYAQVRRLIDTVPESRSFVHGDFHMNNVMLQGKELLLIDVGEAGYGHPLFDFAQTMSAYTGMTTTHADGCRQVLGLSLEEACYVRDNLFPLYFGLSGDPLERKMTVVHGMATLRMLLSPFLQGVEGATEIVRGRLGKARAQLFPQIDKLCALIEREF